MSRPRRKKVECGTHSGYVRHSQLHEKHCEPCRAAKREYQRTHRHAQHPDMEYRTSKYDPIVCGTQNSYERHRIRNEECHRCSEASRLYKKAVSQLRNEVLA